MTALWAQRTQRRLPPALDPVPVLVLVHGRFANEYVYCTDEWIDRPGEIPQALETVAVAPRRGGDLTNEPTGC